MSKILSNNIATADAYVGQTNTVKNLEIENEQQEGKVEKLNDKIESLNIEIENYIKQLQEEKEKVKTLEYEKKELKNMVAEQTVTINTLTEEKKKLESIITSKDQANSGQKDTISDLNDQVKLLNQMIKDNSGGNNKFENQIKCLRKLVEHFNEWNILVYSELHKKQPVNDEGKEFLTNSNKLLKESMSEKLDKLLAVPNLVYQKYENYSYIGGLSKQNLRSGFGFQFHYGIGQLHICEWCNALSTGFVDIWWVNGSRFQGEMESGHKNGFGEEYTGNGFFYKGSYVHGDKCGQGEYHYPDGDSERKFYVGEFKGNSINGQGKMVMADGSCEQGLFKMGVYLHVDGTEENNTTIKLDLDKSAKKEGYSLKKDYPTRKKQTTVITPTNKHVKPILDKSLQDDRSRDNNTAGIIQSNTKSYTKLGDGSLNSKALSRSLNNLKLPKLKKGVTGVLDNVNDDNKNPSTTNRRYG